MAICWMCNTNEATTGEHIFKHSILKELYGEKPFAKGNRLIVHAEKMYDGKVVSSKHFIQSTNADELKFKKSLCNKCNGAYSQAWDNEFDLFLRHLLRNWQTELDTGYVNLKLAHPRATKSHVRHLYNYFSKLFGCLLFAEGRDVPEEIIDIVNNKNHQNNLGINIIFDISLAAITEHRALLVKHDLTGVPAKDLNYQWAFGFGPIKIAVWYKTPKKFIVGKPWFGRTKHIDFIKK